MKMLTILSLVCWLLEIQQLHSADLKWKPETVQWDIGLKKKVNASVLYDRYNPLENEESFHKYQLPVVLDNNHGRVNAFCTRTQPHYSVFIDLVYERHISSVYLRATYYESFQIFINNDEFSATDSVHTHHVYLVNYPTNNIKSRYCHIKFNHHHLNCLYDVKIFTTVSLLPSSNFFDATLEELSHPYQSTNAADMKTLEKQISNFNVLDGLLFQDESLRYLDFYESLPVVWFTMTYEFTMIFHSVVFSTNYREFPDFYFSYKAAPGRKLIEYKKNEKRKIFVGSKSGHKWKVYNFEDVLLVKTVRVYLATYVPRFIMKLNFRGYKSVHFEKTSTNLIYSKSLSTKKPVDAYEVQEIDFGEFFHVFEMAVDHYKEVLEFCISYQRKDGSYVYYKDQPSQTEATVFQIEESTIQFRPFLTRKFHIKCLQLESEINFVVHVYGRYSFELVEWVPPIPSGSVSGIDPNYLVKDSYNIIGLFGTMSNFEKTLPEDRLLTNYFGDSCLTRPETCDNGFTVQFQQKGNFGLPTVDTFTSSAYNVWSNGNLNLVFPINGRVRMTFANVIQYSYAEVVSAKLFFKYTAFEGVANGNMYVYFTAHSMDVLHESSYDFAKVKGNMKSFIYSISKDPIYKIASIDLKDAFVDVLSTIRAEVRNVSLWFVPTLGNVEGELLTLGLEIKTRVKVPGYIHPLQFTATDLGVLTKFIVFGGPHIITQVCLHHTVDIKWNLLYEFTDHVKTSRVSLFDRGEPKPEFAMSFKKYMLCIDFPYPTVLDNLIIEGTYHYGKYFYVTISGTNGSAEIFNQATFPILSAGLHGNHQNMTGEGVTIYYDITYQLHALVRSSNQTFHTYINAQTVDKEKIHTFTIVWDKATLQIYLNGQLQSATPTIDNYPTKPTLDQEYLLLFGNYRNIFSYGTGSYLSFKIWNDVILPSITDDELVYETKLFGDAITTSNFHKESSHCINSLCPLPDRQSETILTKFGIGRIQILDEVDNVLVNNEMKLIASTDNHINIVFLDVQIPYEKAIIESIEMVIHIDNDEERKCNVFIKNTNTSAEFTILGSEDEHNNSLTDVLKEFISNWNESLITIEVEFDKTACFETGKEMQDAHLEFQYKVDFENSSRYITYAHESYSSTLTLQLREGTKCVTFVNDWTGNGFAYISVYSIFNNGTRNEKMYNQKPSTLEIELDSSSKTVKLELVVVRNGYGQGYFRVNKIIQSSSICTNPSTFIQMENKIDTFLALGLKLKSGGLYHLLFACLMDDLGLPLSRKEIQELSYDKNQLIRTPFIHGYSYSHFNGEIKFRIEEKIEEFTIAFWLFYDFGLNLEIFRVTDLGSNKNLVEVRADGDNLKIMMCSDEVIVPCCLHGWVPVIINVFNSFYTIEVDTKVISENKIYCERKIPATSFFEVIIKEQSRVHCLQFYQASLTEDQKRSSLVCPSRYTGTCEKSGGQFCGWCNQLTQTWSSTVTVDNDCKLNVVSMFAPSIYLELRKKGIDSVTTHRLFKANNSVTALLGFTPANYGMQVGDIFYDTETTSFPCGATCTMAVWLKYYCRSILLGGGVVFQTDFLIIKCKASDADDFSGEIEILTRSCGYLLSAPHGFWYHIAIGIESEKISKMYINGKSHSFESDCNMKMDALSNVKLGFGSTLYLDEILLKQEKIYSSDTMQQLFNSYTIGNDDATELEKHTLPIWFRLSAENLQVNDEGVTVKLTKGHEKILRKLEQLVPNGIMKFEYVKIWRDINNRLMIDAPYHMKLIEENFFNLSVKAFLDAGFTEPVILKKNSKDDVVTAIEMSLTKVNFNLKPDSHSVDFHWKEFIRFEKCLIIGIYLDLILIKHLNNETNILNQNIQRYLSYNREVNLADLIPYSTYQINFFPLLPTGVTFDFPINFEKQFNTLQSGPIKAPDLECESQANKITCRYDDLPLEYWHGELYSYEVACLKTSIQQEHQIVSLFNATVNTTLVAIEIKETIFKIEPNEVEFHAKEIYENFTIEIRALTNKGKMKGVSNQIIVRSQIGAPDHAPENVYMVYSNKTISFYWDEYIDNIDYWNSNISTKETWQFNMEILQHFENEKHEIREIPIGTNTKLSITTDMYTDIIVTKVSSQSNGYTGNFSQNVCFILPCEQAPSIKSLMSDIPIKVYDHQQITINIPFQKFNWRGLHKYLHIVIVAPTKIENLSMIVPLMEDNVLRNKENRFDKTFYIETHASYWARIYQYHHFTNNEIERNYTNSNFSCDIEPLASLLKDGNEEIQLSANFTGLHPFTSYQVVLQMCNEHGCDSQNITLQLVETKQFKPTAPPQNLSISPLIGFQMNTSWSTIDAFHINGIIQRFHLNFTITRLNHSGSVVLDGETFTHTIENVGKYENVCFQVAGQTNYPDVGVYSNFSCEYSNEAAPDIAPSFQVYDRSSSSFFIEIKKPTDISELNGIILSVIVKYNVSYTEYKNVTYNISHEEFFHSMDPYQIVLSDLIPFTNYDISLAYVTVATGLFSDSVMKKTKIDAPNHPPTNLSIIYDASSFNLSWDHLPKESWNGPGLSYNITLLEFQFDGGFITSFIVVSPDTNYHYENNLYSYRTYNVSIQACTAAGCSNKTTLHFRTNQSAPCPPQGFHRIESILNKLCVSWLEIVRECVNGILQAYVLYVKQITIEPYEIEKQFNYEIDKSSTENCIMDIPLGRLYNISIAGKTGGGIGEPSNNLSIIFGEIIHGDWTLWTSWTPCTKSCGNATKLRERFCSNPTPVNGRPCSGDYNETEVCDLAHCPGLYLPNPGEFDCNKVCKKLKLKCNNKLSTGNSTEIFTRLGFQCINDAGQMKKYKHDFHPSYNLKEKTCEGYIMINNEIKCNDDNSVNTNIQRICNCKDPASEGLTEWYPWSPCLKTCGESLLKTRKRECISKAKCIANAKLYDEMSCGLKPCPIDGSWGSWQETTECSKSCNGGYRVRVRSCTKPAPDHGGAKCPGPDEDKGRVCNPHPCPVNGGMSLWTKWGACRSTCGISKKRRQRFCNNPVPAYKGLPCPKNRETEEVELGCVFNNCPPLDIILTCHISNRKWHYTMYQMSAQKAKDLEKEFCNNLIVSISNSTEMLQCRFLIIKRFEQSGQSVIPTVHLQFMKIDEAQVVSFVDWILMEGYIGDLEIDDYSINITSVSYEPLNDISVNLIDQTTINIAWTLPTIHASNTHVYIMFIENEIVDKNATWHIEGVETSSNFLTLYYLKPYQIYRAYMVRSNELGHGIPSRQFFIRVNASKPSTSPFNVNGFSITSTSIYVKWNDIPKIYQNGLLKGYLVKYKKHNVETIQTKFVSYGFLTLTLTGLEPYTFYQVDVSGLNAGGEGPADYVMIQTLEGAPSVPVPGVKVKEMQSIGWWSVSWSPLPKNKIHGILRGYRLKYYMSYRSDIPNGGEINWIVKDFDKFTFYHKEKNLLNYATYNLTVTGFTNAGEGPTPEHFARTCRCKKLLFGSWYILNPYTEFLPPSNLTGLFPDLVRNVILEICGKCLQYDKSILHLLKTSRGLQPNKKSPIGLVLSIDEDTDVSFPYYENIDKESIVPGSVFVPLIKSVGCAFIIRDEVNLQELVMNLILKVLEVWPLLVVSYSIAGLCGFIVWFTDQFMNPEEFVVGSSLKGPCIGFWFSFVTMTTVGYGDLTPRSKIARVISMIWFIMGLILNGIIIGFITTAMTSLDQPETAKLYNTKTAALNKSYEYRLAVRRNADVSDKAYTTIDEMLDNLEDKKVDAVLVDLFSMVGYKEKIKSRYLKVKTILDTQTAYGIILSGQSVHLKKDVESRMYAQQDVFTKFIKSIEEDIPSLDEEKAGDVMQLVFGAKSSIFHDTVIWMLIAFACLFFIGSVFEMFRYIHSRRKVVPEKASCAQHEQLELEVEKFVTNITTLLEKMTINDENERIYLSDLSNSIKRYESKIGKTATWARIRWMWEL